MRAILLSISIPYFSLLSGHLHRVTVGVAHEEALSEAQHLTVQGNRTGRDENESSAAQLFLGGFGGTRG